LIYKERWKGVVFIEKRYAQFVRYLLFATKLIGKADDANRLFGSLQVDSSKSRDLLGWKPVITMDEKLKNIADAYLK